VAQSVDFYLIALSSALNEYTILQNSLFHASTLCIFIAQPFPTVQLLAYIATLFNLLRLCLLMGILQFMQDSAAEHIGT
jgi:hypothetical protein